MSIFMAYLIIIPILKYGELSVIPHTLVWGYISTYTPRIS